MELLILPNTDIHHRGLRGLNWKLPTSEINLNRLAHGIVISVQMLNGSQFYTATKSSKERLEKSVCLRLNYGGALLNYDIKYTFINKLL